MIEVLYQSIAITVPAGTGTTNFPFDKLDFSRARALRFEWVISTIGTDVVDTVNLYVQSRSRSGIWADRVAFPQFLGTASDAEVYDMVLRQLESIGSDGEGYEPQGSAGGSRLTAGEVVNGPFPGKYYENSAPAYNWRAQAVVVDADSDEAVTGTLYVYGLEES